MTSPHPLSAINFTAIYVQTLNPSQASGETVVVACARIRNLELVQQQQFLVNPGVPLPEEFIRRSGIYQTAVDEAPLLEDALPEIAAFVGRDIIVWAPISQKNTPVHRYFKLTQPRDRQFFLRALAEKALPDLSRYHLTSLSNHFGITPFGLPPSDGFSAMETVQLTAQLWVRLLIQLLESQQIQDLNDLIQFCPTSNARTFRTRKDLAFDREKLRVYPTQPGVYFMKNRLGEILYIGKAKNLRNRLRSYFQKQSGLPPKIAAMMKQVAQIDVTVVGSELEALLLESRLIKEHMPFFNKKIKDFKRMVFLKVALNQSFPRVSDAIETDDPGAAYFGPLHGKSTLRYKMEILNRVFKLRDCSDKTFGEHRHSPCMQYHLGFCSAPCVGLISQEAYRASVHDFLNYLQQKPANAVDYLIAKRDAYIEVLQFEKASALHQQWEALERLQLQNYQLHQALTEHHCLIILPDTQPGYRRILTVLHGQPIQWNSVEKDCYQSADSSILDDIISHALQSQPAQTSNPDAVPPVMAKALYEEARLISQWLNHAPEQTDQVIYLKNKTHAQILNELRLALSPPADLHAYFSEVTECADDTEDADEAWHWEQAMEDG